MRRVHGFDGRNWEVWLYKLVRSTARDEVRSIIGRFKGTRTFVPLDELDHEPFIAGHAARREHDKIIHQVDRGYRRAVTHSAWHAPATHSSCEIEVRNMFGALVATATLPVRNVLPGVVRKIGTSVGEGFWLGRYTVYLRAKYGDAGQELYSQEKLWVVPWRTQGWKLLLGLGLVVWVIVARRRFRAFWIS